MSDHPMSDEEQVARALFVEGTDDRGERFPWEQANQPMREVYRGYARAAIAAMGTEEERRHPLRSVGPQLTAAQAREIIACLDGGTTPHVTTTRDLYLIAKGEKP